MGAGLAVGKRVTVPRWISVLQALREKSLMNKEFIYVSKHAPAEAQELREELEALGFIRTDTVSMRGTLPVYEIQLTETGRRVLESWDRIQTELNEAAAKKDRKRT